VTSGVPDGAAPLAGIAGATVPGHAGLVDIEITAGRITAIRPAAGAPEIRSPEIRFPEIRAPETESPGAGQSAAGSGSPAARWLPAAGKLVLPAFTESHLHLDKALLGPPPGGGAPSCGSGLAGGGGLAGAIADVAARKAGFTRADIRGRATRVAAAAVAAGTLAIRAQTEVDPGIGLLGVETVSELAAALAGIVRVQLAVFPQEGIFARPGTLELMHDALAVPDSAVGGCPYAEHSVAAARRHIDTVLDLAADLGRCADLHLDLADTLDDPRFTLAGYVAGAAAARGLHGRVVISHASTLGLLGPPELAETLDQLAAAGVGVVLLPATDLYLNGRGYPGVRGLPPLRELWARGVPAALASNNVRNAFTPTGTVNPLDIGLLLARTAHLSAPDEFARVVAMAGPDGTRLLWPGEPAGLRPGARADLLVLDCASAADALLDDPARLAVVAGGQLIARQAPRLPGFEGAARALFAAAAREGLR
jgi:cytosine/creatinine deaminase